MEDRETTTRQPTDSLYRITKMIFQPKHYPTMEALKEDMIWCTNGAHSSESVNNIDIFGYFNDQPYYAMLTSIEFDQIDWYWIAGEVIPAHWL